LELLEVREALEGTAAAAAAKRGAAIATPRENPHGDIERLVAHDLSFHDAIARASGNPVLASLIVELNGILEESRYAMFAIPGRPERSHLDHVRIAEAISGRDPEMAQQVMHEHIRDTRVDVATLASERGDI
jgi:GntR family transcriptional repressor for pyruvate dehydrogenase complex